MFCLLTSLVLLEGVLLGISSWREVRRERAHDHWQSIGNQLAVAKNVLSRATYEGSAMQGLL
jgi:hypothetical protein